MGLALSLRTVYEAARTTVPAFVDAMRGQLDRESADERLIAFSRRAVALAGVRLDVRGVDRVPRRRAFVFMSNHQSHFDIPVLYATIPVRTLRMVAKTELFRIPIWGQALRAGEFIEIDRGDRSQAIASLDRAAAQLRDGVNIWIAPEGSRSRTGALGPLKKGGFHLARNTGAAILPVALSGTYDILRPGTARMAYGRTVRVVFGAPIEVVASAPGDGAGGGRLRDIDELMDEVRQFLEANITPTP